MDKVFLVIRFFLTGDFGAKRKAFGALVLFLIIFHTFWEIMSLSLLVPLFHFVLEPSAIGSDKYSAYFIQLLGIANKPQFLWIFSLSLILFFLIKNVIGIGVNYVAGSFSFNIFKFLSDIMYKTSILQVEEPESLKASEVANEVNIINAFSHNLLLPSLHLLNELMVVLVICFSLFFMSTKGFWIAMLAIGAAFWLCYRLVKGRLNSTQRTLNATYPEIVDSINVGIYGNVDIKATHSHSYFLSRFNEIILRFSNLQVQNYLMVQTPQKLMEVFVMSTVVGIALFMSTSSHQSEIVPVMTALGIAAYRILPSVNRIMTATLSISGSYYTMDLVKKLVSMKCTDTDKAFDHEGMKVPFASSIEVRNVEFAYPNSIKVLDNISFSVEKGETIGIIGKTGSGKSTLLKILLGLKKPQKGGIWVDGQEIYSSGLAEAWQGNVGYVQQNVYLMPSNIGKNIAFGLEESRIDSRVLQKAISDAQLQGLIESLPEGLNTKVGEFGSMLSGGQKQRIGIARALYRECDILILDEATSALDNQTEKDILESIRTLKASGRTLFIVAHRYSVLEYCDKILELGNGRLLRQCTYDELKNTAFV